MARPDAALDPDAFVDELHALGDRFGRKVSETMVRRYYEALQDVPTSAFVAAARTIYNTDTFWPAPARFLQAAGLDADTRARDAWQQILAAIKAGEPYRDQISQTARDALRDIGGGSAIALCDEARDLPHVRRRFLDAYRSHSERRATQAALPASQPETPSLTWGEGQA